MVNRTRVKAQRRRRRKLHIRKKLFGSAERPRLTVTRSSRNIHCQIIDDYRGVTLAAASTQSKELRDQIGNNRGIGARITAKIGDTHQWRELQLGGGFMSFDAPVAHFGLGEATQIDSLRIDWADGSTTQIDHPLTAGATHRITRNR